MKVTAHAKGSTLVELRKNADQVAAELAGDADYTVKIGDVYGSTWDESSGRDTGRITSLSASVEITVADSASTS